MTPPMEGWWIMIRAYLVAKRRPGAAERDKTEPIEAARPVTKVVTGEETIFTWSQMAKPESIDPPGELITKRIGFPGSVNSRYQSFRIASRAVSSSTGPEKKRRLALKSASSILSSRNLNPISSLSFCFAIVCTFLVKSWMKKVLLNTISKQDRLQCFDAWLLYYSCHLQRIRPF